MKNIYLMSLVNFFKSKNYRIGFVINGYPLPYNRVMASIRIRVYDVIRMFFGESEYLVEVYSRCKKYDVLIFQKIFDTQALALARKRQMHGTKIMLDVNVNYYDASSKVITNTQHDNILKFTHIADGIIVPTVYLKEFTRKLFPVKNIWLIEECIDDIYFTKPKADFNSPPNLIWMGYSVKASELLLIKDVLTHLYDRFNFTLLLICEKDPMITIGDIPVRFIKYNHSKVPELLLQGDIFIAPRTLDNGYNRGHSFTKIGVAMATGLPVVASPVPSYQNSPAILCGDKTTWEMSLKDLFEKPALLTRRSDEGRTYAHRYYSQDAIKTKYLTLFARLLKD